MNVHFQTFFLMVALELFAGSDIKLKYFTKQTAQTNTTPHPQIGKNSEIFPTEKLNTDIDQIIEVP